MDGISLQQFLQARETASTRMRASTASTSSTTAKSGKTDWQSVLEAKRAELGEPASAASTPNRVTSSYANVSNVAATDYKARSEQLRSQLAQGVSVRTMGNLLDMRA